MLNKRWPQKINRFGTNVTLVLLLAFATGCGFQAVVPAGALSSQSSGAALGTSGGTSGGDSTGTELSAVVKASLKVLPLGDSITAGNYRLHLLDLMSAEGYQVTYQGTQRTGDFSQPSNEGHPGWRIDQIQASTDLYLNSADPDLVLLMLGTNDIAQDYDLANAPARLEALVNRSVLRKPLSTIIVAGVPPIAPSACAACEMRVLQYNVAVEAMVAKLKAQRLPVHFVSMHAALVLSDLSDGVHPTDAGYVKMAAQWLSAIHLLFVAK